jgi:hypothetical protein
MLRYLGFFFDTKLTWGLHTDIMCNRTRAMIKMLQLLGNSIRGLDQARWKLAYNAICLPVLTYGCQLWYTGKQKGLVKKLQLVQNEAVRIISESFRTAPREPLHQLLNILPMDLRLDKLTQSSALRLYRLPRSSQLLRRLGEGWYQPDPTDPPLPMPNNGRNNTALRTLAARVSSEGPRTDPYLVLPEGVPDWNGRVEIIPRKGDEDYDRLTEAMVRACQQGNTINIFCEGVVLNCNALTGVKAKRWRVRGSGPC